MSYALKYEQKPQYLHVVVTGLNNRENVERYFDEVMRECAARNCGKLLVEERLDGPRLATAEVFAMVSKGTHKHRGAVKALAYVDVHGEGRNMEFAEDVAVNRGFPVRVFPTVAAAEKWLAG